MSKSAVCNLSAQRFIREWYEFCTYSIWLVNKRIQCWHNAQICFLITKLFIDLWALNDCSNSANWTLLAQVHPTVMKQLPSAISREM